MSPAVSKHKSRQSLIRHVASHCSDGDLTGPSQFRQERHTTAQAPWLGMKHYTKRLAELELQKHTNEREKKNQIIPKMILLSEISFLMNP